jgi:hypothetical protein
MPAASWDWLANMYVLFNGLLVKHAPQGLASVGEVARVSWRMSIDG